MKPTNRHWLQIAEYVSFATSAVGTVAAAISGQVIMVSAPLTLALSLYLVNRVRLGQQRLENTTHTNKSKAPFLD